NGCASIVHKDVEPAESRHGLFDRGFDGVGISGVRLNCYRLSASAFYLLSDRRCRIGTFRVGDGHVRSVRGQTLGDCSTNAARATRNECNLSLQVLRHCFSPIPLLSLFADPVAYVRRTVEERDACCFTAAKESNSLNVDQIQVLQVQRDLRFALPNLLPQLGYVLRPHPAYQSNIRSVPVPVLFDLQGHVRPVGRFTTPTGQSLRHSYTI